MSSSIRHLAFLTPGNYAEADPFAGLEAALKLFEFGEKHGFDSAWVRQRHLERGVSSAATFHQTKVSYIYSRYRKVGSVEMDESFFPVLWREDGYRTPWLDRYIAAEPAAA